MVSRFAGERHLWLLVLELLQNHLVGHVADLVVLLLNKAILVTDTIFPLGHQSITDIVRLADVAVDALPAVAAFTVFILPRTSIIAIR